MADDERPGDDSAPRARWEESDPDIRAGLQAIKDGDAMAAYKAFGQSQALDVVKFWVARHHWHLPSQDVDLIVGRAVDELFLAVRNGREVRRPVSWLFKVVQNMAIDADMQRSLEVSLAAIGEDPSADDDVPGHRRLHRSFENVAYDGADDQARRDKVRWGVEIARELLPRIGEANIRRVMDTILVALEQGYADLSNEQIATELGMNVNSVRGWRSFGFSRLRREALKAGYITSERDLLGIGLEEPVEED